MGPSSPSKFGYRPLTTAPCKEHLPQTQHWAGKTAFSIEAPIPGEVVMLQDTLLPVQKPGTDHQPPVFTAAQ